MRGEPQLILDFQDICKSTILRINHIINYIFNSGINSCRSKTLKYIALAFLGFSMGWPSSEFHSFHLVDGVFMGWPGTQVWIFLELSGIKSKVRTEQAVFVV